jgi:hypothetical protein
MQRLALRPRPRPETALPPAASSATAPVDAPVVPVPREEVTLYSLPEVRLYVHRAASRGELCNG